MRKSICIVQKLFGGDTSSSQYSLDIIWERPLLPSVYYGRPMPPPHLF
jgi:hypothetical protein